MIEMKCIDSLFRSDNRNLARSIIEIIDELKEYWPMTVRQVYYQCVARLLVPNRQNNYKAVSRLLNTLRRNNLVPWGAIEDRTRRTTEKRGVYDLNEFIKEQTKYFLNSRYYHRCRVQEQVNYIEVATEKDALSSIMEDVIWPYCTRLNVVRGQSSGTMVEKMAGRFNKAISRGQDCKLLYFGDLDPSGIAIPKALVRNMETYHGAKVELVRVALNPAQCQQYKLPADYDALKPKDPNLKAWRREYPGVPPTELDALSPGDLQNILKNALESSLDMTAFREQMDIEERERECLKEMKFTAMNYLHNQYPGFF